MHQCKPKPKTIFDRLFYQCGCGRYFSSEYVFGEKKGYLHDEFQQVIERFHKRIIYARTKSRIEELERLKKLVYVSKEGMHIGPVHTMELKNAVDSIHKLIDERIEKLRRLVT